MDNLHIAFLAGVLVAVAATYVIWGPSEKPKRKKVRNAVAGLRNLGNTCFMNAVLQALASCPLFITWLGNVINNKERQDDADSYTLSPALLSLIKQLNSGSGSYSAFEVINALRQWRWTISYEEQDAHELFHVLTTTLEDEVIGNQPSVLSFSDVSKLESVQPNLSAKPIVHAVTAQLTKNNLPFRGLLANQLICQQCQNKYPVKYDTFDSISLNIPMFPEIFGGQPTLQNCLQKFVSCEQVSGVICDVCCKSSSNDNNSLQKRATFTKEQSFGKLPDCLCFHIQRSVWRTGSAPTKSCEHVVFPEELCMDSFVHNGSNKCVSNRSMKYSAKVKGGSSKGEKSLHQTQSGLGCTDDTLPSQSCVQSASLLSGYESRLPPVHLYHLKAVIVHLGSLRSGHFITYRRGPPGSSSESKWFCTSDSSTREVPFSEVLNACAYMLYYERVQKNATERRERNARKELC